MEIIAICLISAAVSVSACLITGLSLMSLYLKKTNELLENATNFLKKE